MGHCALPAETRRWIASVARSGGDRPAIGDRACKRQAGLQRRQLPLCAGQLCLPEPSRKSSDLNDDFSRKFRVGRFVHSDVGDALFFKSLMRNIFEFGLERGPTRTFIPQLRALRCERNVAGETSAQLESRDPENRLHAASRLGSGIHARRLEHAAQAVRLRQREGLGVRLGRVQVDRLAGGHGVAEA